MITIPRSLVGTQYGACLIFEEMYGRHTRWIDPIDWFVWSGNQWQDGAADEVRKMIRECGKAIYEKAADMHAAIPDEDSEGEGVADARKALLADVKEWRKWGRLCQESYYQTEMMKQLRGFDSLKLPYEATIRNIMLVNTRTGVVDLSEPGTLHRHKMIRDGGDIWPGENSDTASFHCCQIIPMQLPGSETLFELAMADEASWAKRCPTFYRFIKQTCCNRLELIESLRQAFGYSMTGLTHERTLFVLHGQGANGKSVLMGLFRRLMGSYAASIPASVLAKPANGSSNDREASIYLSVLLGKRFVVSSEYESGDFLPESAVKTLTGGDDEVIGRALYSKPLRYRPQFKIWLMTNHKPNLTTASPSIRARIKMIPFDNIVPVERQDIHLSDKLWEEAPAIATWAMTGWIRAQHFYNGRIFWGEEVRAATDEYFLEQDLIGQFIDDRVVIDVGGKCKSRDMYLEYVSWTKDSGYHQLNQKNFNARMKEARSIFDIVKIHGHMYITNAQVMRNAQRRWTPPAGQPLEDGDTISEDVF